ncbi:MAG: hypothetical protein JW797_04020 [Bradymonadales bacterium]|nr:hypothetical protein [Bradymonadales bacterium]
MLGLPSSRTALAIGLCSLLISACGHHFQMVTPNRFVELDDQHQYAMRATTPDGVVIGVREIDNDPQGTLEFWEEALSNHLRLSEGYALLDSIEVQAATGQSGKQLRFGRDEGERPYHYWTTLFVTDDHIFIIEAGGQSETFEPMQGAISDAISTFRID